MNAKRFTTPHTLTATMVAGAAWIATGALQLTATDEVRSTTTDTFVGHFAVGLLSLALLLMIPAVLSLSDRARSRNGAYVALAGLGLLAVASTVSNIVGHDPTFFLVAAPVANLLWLAGSIWLAVSLWKAGRVPRLVAIGLPLIQVFALPLSFVGGGIVAGAYLIAVAQLLRAEDELPAGTAAA